MIVCLLETLRQKKASMSRRFFALDEMNIRCALFPDGISSEMDVAMHHDIITERDTFALFDSSEHDRDQNSLQEL